MMRNYEEIYKNIKLKGFFSEYLPPCFELDNKIFENIPESIPELKCDYIQPYSFTMSRFNSNDSRRIIFIPEIGSYAVLNEFLKNNRVIEDFTDFIDQYSASFSKVIMKDGTLSTHDQSYDGDITEKEVSSSYLDNIIQKLIFSAGSKKVLKLDIANCYSSLYTHFIPSIILGFDEAEENYKKTLKKENDVDEKYKKYSKLDSFIRKMNKNQTNGLLVGPMISRIIVEGFLTRIDIELKKHNIVFTRYVDDYEVYLKDESEENIKSLFSSVLRKYGLSLNYEKIQLIDFPYYIVENFDKLINLYRKNKVEDYDLMKLFNSFFEIEKSGTKGAIRYLLKSLEKNSLNYENEKLFSSYILTIMANDPRSLTKACTLLLKESTSLKIDSNYILKIKKILKDNISKNNDLEVIWLLYVLIETNNIVKDDDTVKLIQESDNELAHIMLVRKRLVSKEGGLKTIADKALSWILNYELFSMNIIKPEELINRLTLNSNKEFYDSLKEKNIHFCYPQESYN